MRIPFRSRLEGVMGVHCPLVPILLSGTIQKLTEGNKEDEGQDGPKTPLVVDAADSLKGEQMEQSSSV